MNGPSEEEIEATVIRGNETAALLQNHIFEMAIKEAREDAVTALISVDATDADKIREAQANIRAIDHICTTLGGYILAGQSASRQTGE